MSRVLLFVREMVSTPRFPDGDDRPKCIKAASSWTYNTDMLNTVPPLPERVLAAVRAASRWWLVECDSAEAGRTIIAGVPAHMHTGNTCNTCSAWMFNGRILATGGAREGTTHPNAGESDADRG